MFGITQQDSLAVKGIKLCIFFAILLTPLVFSTKHMYFFTTPKYVFMAFIGSICLALLIFHLLETKLLIDKKIKIVLYIATLLIGWFLISSFFAAEVVTSFWSNFARHTGFFTYFFGFVFFIASIFVFNKETLFAPLKAFALGGALAAISVYFSPALLNVDLLFSNSSGNGGTIGNTTYAGIFLAFSFFYSLILFFQEKNKRIKWLWTICFLIILFSPIYLNTKNILTGNIVNILSFVGEARAGLISIFIGLLFSFILYFSFSQKKAHNILAKIILILFFIVGVYGITSLFNEDSKLHQTFAGRVEGVRFFYWDMAMIGIAERPILGYGLESFPVLRNKYFNPSILSPEYPSESWVDKPHNVIFDIALSSGIPGLMFYLSLLGLALISLIRKASVSSATERITASLFFGLFFSYGFQLFFAFDTVSSIQAIFVTLALVYIFCFKEVENVKKPNFYKHKKAIVVTLLTLMCVVMVYFLSFRVYQESIMVRRINTISIQKRISQFKDTMNISPVGTLSTESQHIDFAVEKYKKNWNTFSEDIKEGVKKELEFLLQYSMGRSDKYINDLRFALISAKIANGLYGVSEVKQRAVLDLAREYGMRAINNSPTNQKGYEIMTEVYLSEGKIDEAIKFADMLIGLNGKVPEFHNLVIYIAKIKKDQKLVEEKTKEAKKFIPNYEYGFSR